MWSRFRKSIRTLVFATRCHVTQLAELIRRKRYPKSGNAREVMKGLQHKSVSAGPVRQYRTTTRQGYQQNS
jgi:hypothetical protein